ncbi:DUF4890 domain-containing protein [Hymenobacter aerilatus]|uniref:DUF4890 domain-containing protein n=1 Tax=Hymenobacter aerilatus TaxID=2932251 RepID=A0A8T9SPW7_9BACT|nr:DUF4890 domain-containing protein [Hymenobacter aerilatus]UOR03845.1 DUF4890 domain-containing protein [Hymenobacter aerilatus]
MKKSLILFAAFILSVGAASAQTAQNETGRMQRPMRGQGMRNMTPEQRADQQAQRLTKQLGLSADQTAKVKALALAQQQERQEMRGQASASTDRQAMMQNMKASHAKYEEQLKGVLTSDQYTKYTQMRDERMDKMQSKLQDRKGHKGKMKASTNS